MTLNVTSDFVGPTNGSRNLSRGSVSITQLEPLNLSQKYPEILWRSKSYKFVKSSIDIDVSNNVFKGLKGPDKLIRVKHVWMRLLRGLSTPTVGLSIPISIENVTDDFSGPHLFFSTRLRGE